MKLIFNLILIFVLLMAFVPPFRRFMFWLLVGRQLVKYQKKANQKQQQQQRREGDITVEKNDKPDNRYKGGDYVDYTEVK